MPPLLAAAWPEILDLARHDDPHVRSHAARLAARGGQVSPAVLAVLEEELARTAELDDSCYDELVGGEMLLRDIALGGGPALRALAPGVEKVLSSRCSALRTGAAWAAGVLGDRSLVPALERAERRTPASETEEQYEREPALRPLAARRRRRVVRSGGRGRDRGARRDLPARQRLRDDDRRRAVPVDPREHRARGGVELDRSRSLRGDRAHARQRPSLRSAIAHGKQARTGSASPTIERAGSPASTRPRRSPRGASRAPRTAWRSGSRTSRRTWTRRNGDRPSVARSRRA